MTAMCIGELIEGLVLEGFDELTPKIRQDIAEHVSTFEECDKSMEELLQLDDKQLVDTAYWVLADYVTNNY